MFVKCSDEKQYKIIRYLINSKNETETIRVQLNRERYR